ncbi:MAG: glycosyl hydrolase [Chloroflexi bacterium]|nr:glycosyl hydrolase [Chloroflexota bacterium]
MPHVSASTPPAPQRRERSRRPALVVMAAVLALWLSACTSAPQPMGDPRFGVIMTDTADLGRTLHALGTPSYIDQTITADGIPDGMLKALKLRTYRLENAVTLRTAALAQPGAHWIIGNEPNVPGQDDISPEDYAAALDYYVRTIRAADPTARFVGPDILNMDATCGGCAGFTSGRAWLDEFRTVYRQRFGAAPPFDVWSLHTYDMDWNRLPMGDLALQTEQVRLFRQYLDTTPEGRDRPIWLTEFAVVWGFGGIEWRGEGEAARAYPVGELRREALEGYLSGMLTWLRANAEPLKLQRWFVFSSHGYREPWAAAPAGMALVEAGNDGPKLTPFGDIVRRASLGTASP